jgi:Ca2+-binding EF-hand superfamily protein
MKHLSLPCSCLVLCIGCQASGEHTAPLNLGAEEVSPWNYFRSKYDADADGSVSQSEYDREGDAFARLDRTGDGILDASDFESTGSDLRSTEIEMRALRAIFEYLQEDGDPTELAMDELFLSAEVFDANTDERLEESEFRARADERFQEAPQDDMARMLGAGDPWTALVEGIDRNGDSALSFQEFEAFFMDLDDGDFVLTLEAGSERADAANRIPPTGPRVGTLAPDFKLSPPEGGSPVKLSSFAGRRPVALIFGSYT